MKGARDSKERLGGREKAQDGKDSRQEGEKRCGSFRYEYSLSRHLSSPTSTVRNHCNSRGAHSSELSWFNFWTAMAAFKFCSNLVIFCY